MDAIYQFFNGYTAGELVLMAVTIFVFIVPGLGVKLLDWAKNMLSLEGDRAHYFILALLVVLSIGAMAVTGAFTEVTWDLKTILSELTAALVPAKLAYKKLKIGDPPNEGQ